MATVVRIKRKADQNPADTIVLAPKTAKLWHDEDRDFTFTYAGTFKDPNSEEADETIRRVKDSKVQLRTDPKNHTVDIPTKVREEHRSASKKNRLKLLLQHRAIVEEIHSEEFDDKDLESPHKTVNSLFRLYDVVAEDVEKEKDTSREAKKVSTITCNDVAMVFENVKAPELEEDFVYDVYYTHSELNLLETSDLSVFKCLAPEDFEPEAAYESDLGLDDDSDSNAEDNWRNDYPDEETDFERQLDYYGDYSDDGGTDFISDRVYNLCLDIGKYSTVRVCLPLVLISIDHFLFGE
ncbi:unnamed protein product [Ixodes hexagonus]